MRKKSSQNTATNTLTKHLVNIISETNGISLEDTIDLLLSDNSTIHSTKVRRLVEEFRSLLADFQIDRGDIKALLRHPFSSALHEFFRAFPLPYREEHTHLTGALSAEFVFPRLQKILKGKNGKEIVRQLEEVYGKGAANIKTVKDVERLVSLQRNERFDRYLQVLLVTKLVLTSRQAHKEAAYHMAKEMYEKSNVGHIRLKFTLSRLNTTHVSEIITGTEHLTPEDVVLGLYDGFMQFKKELPEFDFVLSPLFRKEHDFYDADRFANKQEDVEHQIDSIIALLEKYPKLKPYLREIDTVGNERLFYRKDDYRAMKRGFRKLQYMGFQIRSHHGETWETLRRGIQAVDNAMNIWHINTLEHGLALGVNPNYYFHSLYQRILQMNTEGKGLKKGSTEYNEIMDMEWNEHEDVLNKLIAGTKLSQKECEQFTKTKFHHATEVEQYQHDILNRMINKQVSLVALPSSNFRLTHFVPDYKDHPFSWWEKKGVQLGVGTDNYVTLNTNFIHEMLILLYTDPRDLKITKLLMITTGETRRPYISSLMWKMRKLSTGAI